MKGLEAVYHDLSWQERKSLRERYIKAQNGNCWYCKLPLSGKSLHETEKTPVNWSLFPGGKDFLRWPVHLHHDHDTGLTIGAVHAYCNAVSFEYEES